MSKEGQQIVTTVTAMSSMDVEPSATLMQALQVRLDGEKVEKKRWFVCFNDFFGLKVKYMWDFVCLKNK